MQVFKSSGVSRILYISWLTIVLLTGLIVMNFYIGSNLCSRTLLYINIFMLVSFAIPLLLFLRYAVWVDDTSIITRDILKKEFLWSDVVKIKKVKLQGITLYARDDRKNDYTGMAWLQEAEGIVSVIKTKC